MHILVDARMSVAAKSALTPYGEIIELSTKDITYEAISGHPDIFFCPSPNGLIVAPNTPEYFLDILRKKNLQTTKGVLPVGSKYPETARYNTLVASNFIIQNPEISDGSIRQLHPKQKVIAVKQGYVRCNTLLLANETFLTSDKGIENKLNAMKLKVLFINPTCIRLSGFEHGFFGGICGVSGHKLFVNGGLNHFAEENQIRQFVASAEMEIIELTSAQPLDVGTIMFLE